MHCSQLGRCKEQAEASSRSSPYTPGFPREILRTEEQESLPVAGWVPESRRGTW